MGGFYNVIDIFKDIVVLKAICLNAMVCYVTCRSSTFFYHYAACYIALP